MIFFKILNRLGVRIIIPKWVLNLSMFLQTGTRGVSLGVRVVIFDAEGAVFLVKHSYRDGWYFPGGGVERGELPVEAAKREMREEARMISTSEPELIGLFLNESLSVPDYVACFVVRDWKWDSQTGQRPESVSDDGEIIDADFFQLDGLPDDVSPATRRRLLALSGQAKSSAYW